jgi:predicted Na+-dependent transporter
MKPLVDVSLLVLLCALIIVYVIVYLIYKTFKFNNKRKICLYISEALQTFSFGL